MDRKSQPRPGCSRVVRPASSLLSSTITTPISTSTQADKDSKRAAKGWLESKPSQNASHINLVSSNGNHGEIHQHSRITLLPSHLKTSLISATPPRACASSPAPPPRWPTRCPPPPPQPLSRLHFLQTANSPLQPPSLFLFPPLMQTSVTITSRCLQSLHRPAMTPYEWME